jgi:hypothetical protein
MSTNGLGETLINIFTSPGEAFTALQHQPRILFPLALLIVFNVGASLLYMRSVDIPWLLETTSQQALERLPDDQREQALENISKTSPTVVTAIAGVQSGLSLLILLFLPAAYLAIVSLVTNDGYKLKRWFSLVCWCSLPLLLAIVATLANILAGDASHLAPERLNPLSFGNLLGLETGTNIASRVLRSLDLTSVWSLVLLVLGYQAWTSKPLGKSAAIVLAPMIVVVAIVLFFSLR